MCAARSLPSYPLPAAPVIVERGRATALLPDSTVTLRFRGLPLAKLLELCDGRTPYSEIRAALAPRIGRARLDRLVADLARAGILVEANRAAAAWWRAVENPPCFGDDPPAGIELALVRRAVERARRSVADRYRHAPRFRLRTLIENRHSARDFAATPVPAATILALLWAAYGCLPRSSRGPRHRPDAPRSVPSAGATYPLTLGLINLRTVPGLARGLYLAHFRADGAVGLLPVRGDPAQAARAFADPAHLREAQGALVVFGDFAAGAAKYGNRSILLVTLEAGHAAHGAMLAATELGVAHSEVAGFFEDRLRALFATGPRLTPLSTLIFGAPRPAAQTTRDDPPARFAFEWMDFARAAHPLAFHVACVDVEPASGARFSGWGRSPDAALAAEKARAEAFERLACALPQGLYPARVDELGAKALDPRAVVSYLPHQYRAAAFPFRPLAERREYGWKDGTDLLTGRRRAVLAELVFFLENLPRAARAKPYTGANTSGVAAYPGQAGAIERAALELLERDAFMRAWLLGTAGAAIRERSLPATLRARTARLRAEGFETVIRLVGTDPAFVVLAMAQSRTRRFTRVTAAAGFDAADAADHALMELEAMIAAQVWHKPPRSIRPESVRTPADHGSLYAQSRFFRGADFLGRRDRECAMPGRPPPRRGLAAIEAWLGRTGRELTWVDLSGPHLGAGRLSVLRALIPGLLPMTFGFGTEPLGLLGGQRPRAPRMATTGALLPHPFF